MKSIFPTALHWLRKYWGVKRLLCEGGGELNDALFRAGVVDELHLTICPKLFGGRRAPTMADGIGFPRLTAAVATPTEVREADRRRDVSGLSDQSGKSIYKHRLGLVIGYSITCAASSLSIRYYNSAEARAARGEPVE